MPDVKRTKKELWLRLKEYHFDHLVPANFWQHVTKAFAGPDAPTKAFANKLARKLGWTTEFALRAIDEYKKFVYLGMVSDFNVTPSKIVDHVWHEHQLFTQAYRNFCGEVLGRHFDHNPELIPIDDQTGVFQAQYLATLALYKREFNNEPPDDIWGIPKFKPRAIKKDHYKPRNKRTSDSIPGACEGADTPLYMFFEEGADSHSHSVFDGFAGGRSGGAGADASWANTADHHADSVADSGGLGPGTDSGNDGGSSCSSGCGDGGCGGGGGD